MTQSITLYMSILIVLTSCTTDQTSSQNIPQPQETILEKALEQVDSAYFIREVLYLEDLQAFENKLSVLLEKKEVALLKQFYQQTVASLENQPVNAYNSELLENCSAVLDDLDQRAAFELPDLFFLWADLRTHYAAAEMPTSPEEAVKTVLLSREAYSKLTVYDSPLLREARKDKEFEFNFAYKVIGEKAGKTMIEFYELTY